MRPAAFVFQLAGTALTPGLMMRFSRTVLLLALSLAAGARAVAAQTIPSPYRYVDETQATGLFAGYLFTDPDLGTSDSTSLPLGVQSGPLFGVRYQVRASGPLSIEGRIGVSPTDRRLFGTELNADSTFTEPVDLETTVPATLLMADVGITFHLTGPRTWNGLAPFAGLTGGLVGDVQGHQAEEDDIPDEALFRFGPSFAVGAGLGTDWFPTSNASIRVEAQGRLWRTSTPSGFLATRSDERSEWNPAVSIIVGGALHF
jgi:opacity protein-like surface antigen